jgi:ABC-2 type transport system permease protein
MSGSLIILLLVAVLGFALWEFFKGGTGPILLMKELRSFFLSPVAWVVLGLVMLLNGFSFTAALDDLRSGDRAVSLAVYTFNSFPFWIAYFFIFPVITMRLFAEEQKLGTIETLLTAPVSTIQVLLSKYFAALAFYIVLWLPSLLNFLVFSMTCPDDVATIGSLKGSYTIVFLLGVFNIAIGCLASALTKNQLVAAMACFTFCVLHFLLGYVMGVLEVPDAFREFVNYFSTQNHVRVFIDGLIDTRQFVYYISFAVLLLTATYHVLEFRKWKV